MKKLSISAITLSALMLSGCITDIITAPIGLAYNVTKYAVKGTVAVVGGTVDILTPDGDDKEKDKEKAKDKEKEDSSKSDNSK
jgi:outer membrane murein-binding lipoprotein Lpp